MSTDHNVYGVCVSGGGGGQSTPPRETSPQRTFSSPRTVDLDGFSVSYRKVQIQLDMHLGTYGRNISDMDVMDARQVEGEQSKLSVI